MNSFDLQSTGTTYLSTGTGLDQSQHYIPPTFLFVPLVDFMPAPPKRWGVPPSIST